MASKRFSSQWPTVLFDVDGTLVASGELIMNSFQETLDELGMPRLSASLIPHVVGPPLRHSFANFCSLEPELMDEAIRMYRRIYLPRFLEPPMYPGIPELLSDLQDAGIRLGTATSKTEVMAREQLEHLNLSRHFDVIAGANSDPNSTKSLVVADALQRMGAAGADMSKVVLVGDRSHDVEGAEDNRIGVIGAGWGYGSPEEFDSPAVVGIANSVDNLRQLLL